MNDKFFKDIKNEIEKEEKLTREEFATIIFKYIEKYNINIPAVLMLYPPYDDEAQISDDAKIAVDQMRYTGLMQAKKENMFKPKSKVTKKELAAVFKKLKHLIG